MLHLAYKARVGRNSVLAYCTAWEVWESTSFASLNIEVWSASPIQWITTLFNVTVKGGIRPVHRPLDKLMIHRIDVALIHMHRIIRVVTNSVFPEPALPKASFAACNPHRRAPFTVRQALDPIFPLRKQRNGNMMLLPSRGSGEKSINWH